MRLRKEINDPKLMYAGASIGPFYVDPMPA